MDESYILNSQEMDESYNPSSHVNHKILAYPSETHSNVNLGLINISLVLITTAKSKHLYFCQE
jgi:hypothetical protein